MCWDFVQNETQVIEVTYFGKQTYLLSDTQPFLMFLTDNTLHLILRFSREKVEVKKIEKKKIILFCKSRLLKKLASIRVDQVFLFSSQFNLNL